MQEEHGEKEGKRRSLNDLLGRTNSYVELDDANGDDAAGIVAARDGQVRDPNMTREMMDVRGFHL